MGDDRIAKLPPRQLECMRRVAQLETSDVIATALGISTHTVDSHIASACRTLGVNTRLAGARIIMAHDRDWRNATSKIPLVDVAPEFGPATAADTNGELQLRDPAAEQFEAMPPSEIATPDREMRSNDLTMLQRLALIALIACLFAVIVIAATPMAESFKALANVIDPHR